MNPYLAETRRSKLNQLTGGEGIPGENVPHRALQAAGGGGVVDDAGTRMRAEAGGRAGVSVGPRAGCNGPRAGACQLGERGVSTG